jgi:hypothetical protein
MNAKLKQELADAFALSHDVFDHLDEASLLLDLPNLPSNRMAGQAWCIAGARESYLRGIRQGGWQGFSCSLANPRAKAEVLQTMAATSAELDRLEFAGLGQAQTELAFALLRHEVQHHGQLIRYVYANGLTFPASWNARYTV